MFDLFAPSHLLLIAIAILIFVGPKDLPRFMHAAGKWTKKARGLANEFRDGLDKMEQQGNLDELRKEIAALRSSSHLDRNAQTSLQPDLAMKSEPAVVNLEGVADNARDTVVAA